MVIGNWVLSKNKKEVSYLAVYQSKLLWAKFHCMEMFYIILKVKAHSKGCKEETQNSKHINKETHTHTHTEGTVCLVSYYVINGHKKSIVVKTCYTKSGNCVICGRECISS